MNCYAVQVRTGKEAAVLEQIKKAAGSRGIKLINIYFPRRTLYIKKQGEKKKTVSPIFPGYLFVEVDALSPELYFMLRTVKDFYQILPNNKNPEPLPEKDRELLYHFLSFGEIIRPSKAYFDENSRICIVEGPLKGLEGKIIKADKRKQRAKIILDMYHETFPIDLAFELIQPALPQPHIQEVKNT